MSPSSASAIQDLRQELLRRTTEPDLSFTPAIRTVNDVHAFAKKHGAVLLDLVFVDVPGTLQHTTRPLHELSEESAAAGFGFDGSSIRGFQEIQESDMLLIPDLATTILDPFGVEPTVSVLCDAKDPVSSALYDNSPRTIAHRAAEFLKESGIADTAYFGPEAEFFIFDDVQISLGANHARYSVDSCEACWNSNREEEGGNLGYKIRHKEGYFPLPPADQSKDIRAAMVRELERAGIKVENSHHEVATAGQAEIDMERAELLPMADGLMRYKHITRNVARRFGKTATFMPKPLFGDNGSGMHVHQSLWKGGRPLFAGSEYAGLSPLALHYIGGLLHHAPALCALCCPTTNSYKRLVPGFEAPVNFIYSARNRSAAVRIPMYSENPRAKRVEFRTPDPAANPYLAFAAMLCAGFDGIRRAIAPGPATDENLYKMDRAKLEKIPHAPADLSEALDALDEDHAFLTENGIFSEGFIASYLATKRAEVSDERMRPTPHEFHKYFDV